MQMWIWKWIYPNNLDQKPVNLSPSSSANPDAVPDDSGRFPLPSTNILMPDLGRRKPEPSPKEGSAAPEPTDHRAGAEDPAPDQESHDAGNMGADSEMIDSAEQPQAQSIVQNTPL